MPRNGRSAWTETGDRHPPKQVIDMGRNTHAGVDRGEAHTVGVDPDRVEDPPHIALIQDDDGQFLLALGARDIEHGPRVSERLLIEELDATEGDGVRAARDLLGSRI